MLWATQVQPWHADWQRTHRPAFRERVAADPVGAALVRAAFGRTWTADFLTVPPPAPDLTLDEELEYLESLDDRGIRPDLEEATGPLPRVLRATGLGHRPAELPGWTWRTTLEPEW